jgi:hypothetical protein
MTPARCWRYTDFPYRIHIPRWFPDGKHTIAGHIPKLLHDS